MQDADWRGFGEARSKGARRSGTRGAAQRNMTSHDKHSWLTVLGHPV